MLWSFFFSEFTKSFLYSKIMNFFNLYLFLFKYISVLRREPYVHETIIGLR